MFLIKSATYTQVEQFKKNLYYELYFVNSPFFIYAAFVFNICHCLIVFFALCVRGRWGSTCARRVRCAHGVTSWPPPPGQTHRSRAASPPRAGQIRRSRSPVPEPGPRSAGTCPASSRSRGTPVSRLCSSYLQVEGKRCALTYFKRRGRSGKTAARYTRYYRRVRVRIGAATCNDHQLHIADN